MRGTPASCRSVTEKEAAVPRREMFRLAVREAVALMTVAEEVAEIERMKAFGLAASIGVTFLFLTSYLTPVR